MALIKFFICNLIIRFFSMLERRSVNDGIFISNAYRQNPNMEYVFPSFYSKKQIFLSILKDLFSGPFVF